MDGLAVPTGNAPINVPMKESFSQQELLAILTSPPSQDDDEEEQPDNSSSDCCLICYEALDAEQGGASMTLPDCRHTFCRSCLAQHAVHSVWQQRQLTIPCPCRAAVACDTVLTTDLVEELLSDKQYTRVWRLYGRLAQLSRDPSLLACPWCDALTPPTDPHDNATSCTTCQRVFCRVHGSAHAQQSCEAYLQRQRTTADRQSERVLRHCTLPCSHCGGRIQKAEGCDHVLCPACHQDMCFRCGTHEYLKGKVIRSCSNCRLAYVDHRHARAYRVRVLVSLPLLLPSFILYTVFMIFLAVGTLGFGCCFGGGRWLPTLRRRYNAPEEDSSPLTRACRLSFSLLTLPLLMTLHDLGIADGDGCGGRWARLPLPFELLWGRPAPTGSRGMPEIPTMRLEQDNEDAESATARAEGSESTSW
jgi:hypothetical protein